MISETGSMNKAAERLYISQPSLTGAVQELEKELGITVFHRSARGVTLTNDGQEFIAYAKQVYDQYEQLTEKYGPEGNIKKKFGVTTQHYSFAVKAFVEMVKGFDTSKYEFAIREARTREVIDDVASLRSEIGILYLSDFNRKVITKILNANEIAFHELIDCKAYVYLWKGHPLADKKKHLYGGARRLSVPFPDLKYGDRADDDPWLLCDERDSRRRRTRQDCDQLWVLPLSISRHALCRGLPDHTGADFSERPHSNTERRLRCLPCINCI